MELVSTPMSAEANSYVSLEFADDYFTYTSSASQWAALTDDEKVVLLVSATRYLDLFEYQGYRTAPTQALSHPRLQLLDREQYSYVDSSTVVHDMQMATCSLALYLKANEASFSIQDTLREAKLGPLQVKFDKRTFGEMESLPLDVVRHITPYLESSRGNGLSR